MGMTPSRSSQSSSWLEVLSSAVLTCFALVRPSHLYLGVARQKKGARGSTLVRTGVGGALKKVRDTWKL